MATNLVQLKVVEVNGSVERDFIATESTSMYNLHRIIQFCVKPRQSDSTIDGKAFKFYGGSDHKLIKGPKGAELKRNSVYNDVNVGDRYTYEYNEGNKAKKFLVEVVDISAGDARYEVPRCIAGKDGAKSADLDAVNTKLLVRRFTKAGAGQRKSTQKFWCSSDTPQEVLWRGQLNRMKDGLGH